VDGETPPLPPLPVRRRRYQSSRLRWGDILPATPGEVQVMRCAQPHIGLSAQWEIYGTRHRSTYQYALATADPAGVPADPSSHFTTANLAAVRDTYRGQDASAMGAEVVPQLPA